MFRLRAGIMSALHTLLVGLFTFLSSAFPYSVSAQTAIMTARGEYRMGTYDNQEDAARIAALNAKWQALDEVVAYLGSGPEVKKLKLSREELRTYTVGMLRMTEHTSQTDETGTSTVVSVKVSLEVNSATISHQLEVLLQNEQVKTELTKVVDTIDGLRKGLETESQKLATVRETSQAEAVLHHRQQILSRIETEEQLVRTWIMLIATEDMIQSQTKAREGTGPHKQGRTQQALAGDPASAEEHRKRGMALNEQGNYEAAIKEFRAALRLLPSLTRAHLGLGAALQGTGHLDEAIVEYQTLLNLDPDDAAAHNSLGTALQSKGDLEGAINEYRTILRSQPQSARAHFNLGTALSTKGAVEEAIVEYRTAIRLHPEFAQAYFDLGSLLKATYQVVEAVQAFRDYVRLAPNTPANRPLIEQAQAVLFELEADDRSSR